jgi:hypothetical protein
MRRAFWVHAVGSVLWKLLSSFVCAFFFVVSFCSTALIAYIQACVTCCQQRLAFSSNAGKADVVFAAELAARAGVHDMLPVAGLRRESSAA